MNDTSHTTRFDVLGRMLADLGTPLLPNMRLMDFGCGEGRLVEAALSQGLDAYGCDLYDVRYSYDWNSPDISNELRETRRLRPIQLPYRLPFEDSCMDVIISDQVFEHVLDYPQAIAETYRVLRPGGVFLHCFPSRYRCIETHIHVPMASMFAPHWWLWLWAAAGVRNRFQAGLSPAEVVARNERFLEVATCYLGPRRIKREFRRWFSSVEFVEHAFLPYSQRPRVLGKVPLGAVAYGLLCSRFLYGRRASHAQAAPPAERAAA